jgi:regulator of sigma E protease
LTYLAIVPILGFLMIAHEFGHFITAKRAGIVVEEFAIGFPPRIFSFVWRDVRYSLNLLPLGAYVKMLGEEDPTAPGSFASQPKWVRAIVLAAGSGMNFLVAVLAFALAYATGMPDPNTVPVQIQIGQVQPGSPAETSGLLTGDVVLSINGESVNTVSQLQAIVKRQQGQPTDFSVRRGDQVQSIVITPRTETPQGQGALGVGLQPIQLGPAVPVPHGPIESLGFGFKRTVDVIGLTLSAPAMVISGRLSPEMARPTGLPGMTSIAGDAAAAAIESGWLVPILMVAGLFSAGLSVANMLPLPALDGGRLLFVVIEAVRGRRVSPEREGLIHLVGMAVLLTLMVFISFNDITSPLPSIDWGVR